MKQTVKTLLISFLFFLLLRVSINLQSSNVYRSIFGFLGYRLGKGEGFADLEWAMMYTMGAVNENTVVVTTVHDHQILDIPEQLIEEHDLTVDYIVTPTEVIKTNCTRSKVKGIIWSKLDKERLKRIPVLKKLRKMQRANGIDVRLRVIHFQFPLILSL